MKEKNKDPDFTCKLSDIIRLILGDSYSEPFPQHMVKYAEVVEALSKNTYMCHVQWPDKYNPNLRTPVLWVYAKWVESCDRWERAKKRSDEERAIKFVFDANVARVAAACEDELFMQEEWAKQTAFALVKHNKRGAIRIVLGVEKLYEKVEEL